MSINIIEKARCSGCHACYVGCPENCISMVEDSEGFLYPKVDNNKCNNCGLCEKICPILNYRYPEKDSCGLTFAAINNDESIRLKSSSGGVFTAIAEKVIELGGVVFGAAFDEEFLVKTIYVESVNDLEKLRGSKYVQSIIGDTYRQAKEFLEAGRFVLFSGTPCQIGGLYSFLQKKYNNLLTVDFICHGVPSPLAWKKYLDYVKNNASASISDISFRFKENGWKDYSVRFKFTNGEDFISKSKNNPYMFVFLNNYSLRPSCYDCYFKSDNHISDITLADFWGVEQEHPEMDDNIGTSLVIINSNAGKSVFDCVSNTLKYISVNFEKSIKYNPCYYCSVLEPVEREIFFKKIEKHGFNIIVKRIERSEKINAFKLKIIYKTETNKALSRIKSLNRKIVKAIKEL